MSPNGRTIIHVPRRFAAEEWGGTETVILEISRQQQRAGFHPKILTSMALASRREESMGGIPVHRYPYCYPFFGLSDADRAALDKKGGNLLSLSLLHALFTTPDVRLFHAHALNRLGGQVRTAARWRRKPLVVSLHGGVFDVPAAELGGMLKPVENKIEWGKIFGAVFGSRRILNDADLVICVGQSELDSARSQLSHDRVAYLPNGVDSARFADGDGPGFRARHGIPTDAFLVLNLSRIDAQKNQRVLLEAFRTVIATLPSARLLLIGPETQPAYAESLRSFIHSHGLSHAVQILPGLRNDNPDLIHAFHACDTFVLPSIHEPFGIVVLEAWSAGKPVVVSHVGGLKALVQDGVTGCFFAPDRADASEMLADRLLHLGRDPDTRLRLARAGQNEARERYDWRCIARQLEDLYQGAETNHRRRLGGGHP